MAEAGLKPAATALSPCSECWNHRRVLPPPLPPSAVLPSQRRCLLTPFPRLFPSPPSHLPVRAPTPAPRPPERPRPSPPAAFLPTRGPHHARSPPCPTREGEIRPRPASSEAWERQGFVLLCAGARGPAPGRQRARHVTATLAPSAWSHASADFPPFPSRLGTFEKQKARFPPWGERRVNLETGLQEGERRCQGQLGLCQGQESQPMSINYFPPALSGKGMLGGVGCAGRRRLNRFLRPTASISGPLCHGCVSKCS